MRSAWLGWALMGLALASCDLGARAPAPTATEAPEPRIVAVDWLGRGTLYAARVTDERGEFTRIEYADGDHEWVPRERLQPWPDLMGQRVQFYTGNRAVNVTVEEVRDGLLRVSLDDGAHTWISPDMLYRLEAPEAATQNTDTPARSFPVRPGVDPSQVRVGQTVLAFWVSNGALQTERPWRARVAAVDGETVHLSYLDGTEADLPIRAILRVFEGDVRPSVGDRYWMAGEHPAASVVEQRAGLTKIRVGETESWVEGASFLAPCPAIDAARLEPGMHVTALWSGNSLYHGTVVSVAGDQVTLAWHDGSEASAVAVADVLEIWQAPPQ